MISRSTDICPEDPVIRTVYLGLGKASRAYARARRQLRPTLSDIFPGNAATEEYFRDVLSC